MKAHIKKVELLGHADNETAIILGVDPNTPAASVRQTALDKANQIELMKTQTDEQLRAAQAQYEMENTIGMDIYKRKTEIGTQAAIDQYQATIGAKGSGKKGSGGSGGSGGYVATAIQEYAANHGLGSYLNMSAEEIANVINSVVADEEQRKQYTQYGIAANDTPSVNPQNTPIQTSEYRFAVEGKPKVEPIFKIYTPTPQKKISTEEKTDVKKFKQNKKLTAVIHFSTKELV